jgi:para-nitrobenzyl esterase
VRTLFTLLASAVALSAAITEPVRLGSGLISGVSGIDPQVRVFKGIPFAAPPIGPLRWRPPQPAAHWNGVRQADQFSAICPQPARTGMSALLPTSYRLGTPNEDCLYLNIWTTARSSTDKLPVIVYLPGGGFTAGSGSALIFDGESLAKRGVVLVTINYRLGALGFLAHPELTKESDHNASGNYGLMDQVAALQWLRKNIMGFGGDANQITAFGQSAGAGSVCWLMAPPLAQGLFQRAIADSGGGPPPNGLRKRREAEQAGSKLMAALGAKTIAELRALPFDAFLALGGNTPGPTIDGWFLPNDPMAIFRQGKQNDVPLLVGSNSDEGNNQARPVAAAKYIEESKVRYGGAFDSYMKLYPADSEDQARASQISAMTDSFAWRVWTFAKLHSATAKSPAYLYYFSRQPPVDAPIKGAYHTAELYYVFGNQRLYKQQWADWDRRLSDIASSYWVNFATRGNPNGPNLPRWMPYSEKESSRLMVLGDKVEMGASRLTKPVRDFLDSYDNTQLAQ